MPPLFLRHFGTKQPVVLSITKTAAQSAKTLIKRNAQYRWLHVHQAKNFGPALRYYFKHGHPIVAICATGIVCRILGPLLANKNNEGPVLVLDQKANFVLPLIGAHRTQANLWGQEIARSLDAQCMITTEKKYITLRRVLGIGCIKNADVSFLSSLMAQYQLGAHNIDALASIDLKQNEAAIKAVAKQLNVPFITHNASVLLGYQNYASSCSQVVFDAVGVYNVCECAAVAALFKHFGTHSAQVLLSKKSNTQCTVALAQGYVD